MRKSKTSHGERVVKDIKRKTRKQYSAEEKIRIVRGFPSNQQAIPGAPNWLGGVAEQA